MRHNRWGARDDYAAEQAEEREKEMHDARQCDGLPCCSYCLDEWEEENREELDREGYYDSNGRWVK